MTAARKRAPSSPPALRLVGGGATIAGVGAKRAPVRTAIAQWAIEEANTRRKGWGAKPLTEEELGELRASYRWIGAQARPSDALVRAAFRALAAAAQDPEASARIAPLLAPHSEETPPSRLRNFMLDLEREADLRRADPVPRTGERRAIVRARTGARQPAPPRWTGRARDEAGARDEAARAAGYPNHRAMRAADPDAAAMDVDIAAIAADARWRESRAWEHLSALCADWANSPWGPVWSGRIPTSRDLALLALLTGYRPGVDDDELEATRENVKKARAALGGMAKPARGRPKKGRAT